MYISVKKEVTLPTQERVIFFFVNFSTFLFTNESVCYSMVTGGTNMANKKKPNSVSRSMARGAEARGTTGINENGKDAYKKSRQSLRGHYTVSFTKTYDKVTERDIELRRDYAKDLVAQDIGVPVDMITLKARTDKGKQTLTALDEVFYVKVGKDTYGKVSIRTQRLLTSRILIFVFQVKKNAPKPPQKPYSRNKGFKRKTTSQKSETNRKSYRNRRGGTL
jgi:hypothetical protein